MQSLDVISRELDPASQRRVVAELHVCSQTNRSSGVRKLRTFSKKCFSFLQNLGSRCLASKVAMSVFPVIYNPTQRRTKCRLCCGEHEWSHSCSFVIPVATSKKIMCCRPRLLVAGRSSIILLQCLANKNSNTMFSRR